MCIARIAEYSCGHKVKEYMNSHCGCALLVGGRVTVSAPCPSSACRQASGVGRKRKYDEFGSQHFEDKKDKRS